MKAKKFKQFVTEEFLSSYLSDSDILVMVEDCMFIINDELYRVDLEIAATVGENDDEGIRHFGSRYFAKDWRLYGMTYCMWFKDPEIRQLLLNQLETSTKNMNRLKQLGITDNSPALIRSRIIDKALSTYPMEEPPISFEDYRKLESILADQLKNDNYTEISYKSNDTFAERLNNILADRIGELNGIDDDY